MNVKAWFRSASACLALDKIPEAEDACSRGLEVDSSNAALKTLKDKIQKRKDNIVELTRKRREQDKRAAAEVRALATALKTRNIKIRTTDKAPNTEDAIVKLSNPIDASSTLCVPVILLYPTDGQSDFIKSFEETQSLNDHLSYILPLPWDQANAYAADVECYIETTTGGLIKAGKKLPLLKILLSGKIEILDGLVKVYVIPKEKATAWIQEFKLRQPRLP